MSSTTVEREKVTEITCDYGVVNYSHLSKDQKNTVSNV